MVETVTVTHTHTKKNETKYSRMDQVEFVEDGLK